MTKAFAVLTFLATVAFAAGPFLTPQFGGFDPNLYPNPQIDPPVQPSGYAFAIWGVIYIWLIVSAGYGLLKRRDAIDWAPMRPPLFVSLLIGSAWLTVAERSPIWATILIFAMLATALTAMIRAPRLDPLLARAPIALYAGWLTAASFAGLGLLGAGYGVFFGEVGWAYLGLAGAFAVAVTMHTQRRDAPLYPLGVAWALIAIAVQNWGTEWGIALTALAAAAILLALSGRAYKRAKRQAAQRDEAPRTPPTDLLGRAGLR